MIEMNLLEHAGERRLEEGGQLRTTTKECRQNIEGEFLPFGVGASIIQAYAGTGIFICVRLFILLFVCLSELFIAEARQLKQ